MRLNFACVTLSWMMALGVVTSGYAQLVTTPYIAIHTTPKFAQAYSMPYANAKAPKGGLLSQAANGTFDNLNTMNGKGNAADGVNYLFDTLMDSSLDEPNVMYPRLAEKVTYDPVKTKFVIYHLNPKARFSNGQPVTAEDVKHTFEMFITKANPGLQMYLSDIDRIEVLSKREVKIHFKSENNTEMPLILSQMPIYSKADWASKDFSRITMQPILGSGPYLIDRIDAGRSITYKRNPNYWGKDLAINRGRYNFDRIKFVYYRNLDIAFEGFKSGQYTFHEEFKSRTWVVEYDFSAVKAGMVKKYIAQTKTPIPTQSFVINSRKPPLDDIYFRQALNYAYDFEWLNKALFYGQYQRLKSHFQNSELEAKGAPSSAEMEILKAYLPKLHPLQRQGVLANWQQPISDGSGFNRKGLLAARDVLEKAGYHVKKGKLLDKKGQPIHIELLIYQDGLQRTLMAYIRNLKKLGISANVRQVDTPQYIERMRKFDFEISTMVMPQSLTPGNEQAQMWSSRAANEEGNYNYAGVQNPVIDDAVQKIINAPSREELIIRTKVLDRLLRAGYYQVLTYGKGGKWHAYWNMYKQPSVKPQLSVGVDYWWVDSKQAEKVSHYLRQK